MILSRYKIQGLIIMFSASLFKVFHKNIHNITYNKCVSIEKTLISNKLKELEEGKVKTVPAKDVWKELGL